MSTLWTPDGERPVPRRPDPSPPPPAGQSPAGGAPGAGTGGDEPDDAAMAAHLEGLRQQLATAPVEAVVANHAYGLFELAAVHLSVNPVQLEAARLAIDALGTLVEGLAGRLGDTEPQLSDGLAQLRIAYVQLSRGLAADQRSGIVPGNS